ncbi:hypothetical protein ABTY59_31830 [Streptomyces sp. NPDC096079]|uniref:hypothetical protein n=1 Tax=Streptomyces sp. NPDC096079 TaxID=3155820 RepID=UPI00331EDC52
MRLSYRELGVLVYLLDQKEGWQVRSDQLSKGEGREGREAIRKVLNKLASLGYYRMERRRLLDGKFVMGTAVSEQPVEQWVKDHEIFSTKSNPAVPVVEQPDGSFLVEYPDGTYGSDGFEPDLDLGEEPPAEPEPEEEHPSGEALAPAAVKDTAAAAPKKARRPRRTSAQKAADDAEKAQAAQQKEEEKTRLDAAAEEVAKWWWEHAKTHLGAFVGKTNGYLAMRAMVRRALEAGYTQKQCASALQNARQHLPSPQQWQKALGIASNHIVPSQPNGRTPYSDAAAWGEQSSAPASTPAADASDDSDDATFGVIARP